jgi:hypothetical protein
LGTDEDGCDAGEAIWRIDGEFVVVLEDVGYEGYDPHPDIYQRIDEQEA